MGFGPMNNGTIAKNERDERWGLEFPYFPSPSPSFTHPFFCEVFLCSKKTQKLLLHRLKVPTAELSAKRRVHYKTFDCIFN